MKTRNNMICDSVLMGLITQLCVWAKMKMCICSSMGFKFGGRSLQVKRRFGVSWLRRLSKTGAIGRAPSQDVVAKTLSGRRHLTLLPVRR